MDWSGSPLSKLELDTFVAVSSKTNKIRLAYDSQATALVGHAIYNCVLYAVGVLKLRERPALQLGKQIANTGTL
jgi:hypothetical protein